MKDPVIAVALSGGVDSLVTAYLLKEKYKKVFGIHFSNGYEQQPTDIKSLETQLGIEIHVIDLSEAFEKKVVQYMIDTYLAGQTPNPCLICNREIKFGELLKHSKTMGADYLATGHYAHIVNSLSDPEKSKAGPYIKKGKDPLKDQSYFLSLLNKDQLNHIVFPLAGMIKTNVKELAKKAGLKPLQSNESQDICFIHDNDLAGFIEKKHPVLPAPGNIVDLEGTIVGRHSGLHQFTIGQRRGINCPAAEPYYVKQIDMKKNELVVCFKKDLSFSGMNVGEVVWNKSVDNSISGIETKIRYNHKGVLSTIRVENDRCQVHFNEPQNAVTPGQGAVFYKDDRVLGAGIIQ